MSRKIGATDFVVVTFTNIDGFSQFFVHNFKRECQSHWRKISCHTFVMLLPYRVKVSDTKVTHFTPILALCTRLYRSYLQKPVSMKQTKHSRSQKLKIYVQNVHHSREYMHSNDYATAQSLWTVWSSSLQSLISRRSFNSFTSWIRER